MTDVSVIEYLLRFLLGDIPEAEKYACLTGYTDNYQTFDRYKVIIIPSGFFDEKNYGNPRFMPALPLPTLEESPVLFGQPEVSFEEGRVIVKADIVASAYFLLSRYEEYVKKDVRDIHGRFPAKASLPYRAGFLHRPVVEEYGRLLRKWIRMAGVNVPEPPQRLRRVFLTSDIDIPYIYQSLRGLLKSLLNPQQIKTSFQAFVNGIEHDPAFTFPWFAKQTRRLIQPSVDGFEVRSVYFFKTGGNAPQDKPVYSPNDNDIQYLFEFCRNNQIHIGLHPAYQSGEEPERIFKEKQLLEKASRQIITASRHHFLRCKEAEDFQYLESAGITDDFTMGYAGAAGFRLGTCRPVRWIHPAERSVHALVLHPLTVMDCTLESPIYMNLSLEQAFDYVSGLIRQTALHYGELTLLWHNHSILPAFSRWQKELYERIIDELCKYESCPSF
jgi:hypothetical protein